MSVLDHSDARCVCLMTVRVRFDIFTPMQLLRQIHLLLLWYSTSISKNVLKWWALNHRPQVWLVLYDIWCRIRHSNDFLLIIKDLTKLILIVHLKIRSIYLRVLCRGDVVCECIWLKWGPFVVWWRGRLVWQHYIRKGAHVFVRFSVLFLL